MNIFNIILLLVSAALWSALQAQSQAVPVRAAMVKQELTAKRHVVTGSVRARQRSDLACQESGIIEKLDVRSGQHIKKGDIIAKLDSRRLQIELEQAQLAVQRSELILNKSKVTLQNGQSELQRREQASKENKGAVSKEILERMRMQVSIQQYDYQVAEQDLALARKRLTFAAVRLEDAVIKAPFDAVVVQQHVEEGEWVNAGDAIAVITAAGPMEVVFDVPEQQLMSEVRKMEELSIVVAGMREPLMTKHFRVVPDVDPRSRRYKIIAELENASGRLAPGMSSTCAVSAAEQKEYILIPDDALMRDAGGAYVFKVGSGQDQSAIAVPVAVKVLFMDERQIAVDTSALKAGDQVVIEGNERLRPMTSVQVLAEPQQ